ncbi:MAG: hypothetical protein DCC71_18095, partial [Proteobacteria bacterium]
PAAPAPSEDTPEPAPAARESADAAAAGAGEPVALAAAATVLVHVNALPWARIEVDGRDLGLTPLGNVPLASGTRRFRAEMPDGRVIEREIAVGPDNRRVIFP